jgi:hypothetical protein
MATAACSRRREPSCSSLDRLGVLRGGGPARLAEPPSFRAPPRSARAAAATDRDQSCCRQDPGLPAVVLHCNYDDLLLLYGIDHAMMKPTQQILALGRAKKPDSQRPTIFRAFERTSPAGTVAISPRRKAARRSRTSATHAASASGDSSRLAKILAASRARSASGRASTAAWSSSSVVFRSSLRCRLCNPER